MSDCAKVRGFLNKYFKDELDKKKRLYVEAHVKKCIMCSAEMEFARKKASVSELLFSLQPQPSFFKRIVSAPQRTKKKIKKAFSKHPVLLPTALILLFSSIPAGFYIKSNNIRIIKTEKAREIDQTAEEIKKPSILIGNEKKTAPVNLTNPAQIKQAVKDTRPAIKERETKSEQRPIAKPNEAVKKEEKTVAASAKVEPAVALKKEEKKEKTAEAISHIAQTTAETKKEEEQKILPALYRLKLKSDLLPDAIFTKIDSLSENSGAVILSTKGFMPDSSEKKEIMIRMPKDKYEGFLSEIKNQFTDVLSKADKNLKLSNDITKQEDMSFVLIEIN